MSSHGGAETNMEVLEGTMFCQEEEKQKAETMEQDISCQKEEEKLKTETMEQDVGCPPEVQENKEETKENIPEELQATMEKTKAKLCAMCGAQAKYCCPACSVRTCSLICVNAHKSEKQCSGVRDKTKFVDVNDFSNMNLLSAERWNLMDSEMHPVRARISVTCNSVYLYEDYRFLEEVARAVDNSERTRKEQGFLLPRHLPINLFKLKKAAKHRKTLLHIMPKVFSRRKVNTTFLRYSDNVIFWRIEWSFPQIGEVFCDDKVDEKTSVNYCLDKYLSPDHSSLEIQEKLSYFQALGHKGVSVLLKKEKGPANDAQFFELNKNKSFRENFANKEITEYPTLFVIGKEHRHVFNLVENNN